MAKKKDDMVAYDLDPKTRLVKAKVEYIDPELLIPYKYNARKHQSEIEKLCNIMKKVGFPVAKAIEVDKNLVIINGHGRRLAAMKLGMKQVPYIVRDMSDKLARTYRIADNRISDLSGWDFDVLQIETMELKGMDVPLEDFGFEDMGFDEPVDDTETVVIDEDEVTERIPQPINIENDDTVQTKTYHLGAHTIMLNAVPAIINRLVDDDEPCIVICSEVNDFNTIVKTWEEIKGEIAKKG